MQAAIACLHARAASAADTDWRQIAALYGTLANMAPSPMVRLNRAAAIGMADGPGAGLRLVDELRSELSDHHLMHATRAELLHRAGHDDEAALAYERAIDLADGAARADLERRRADVLGDAV